MLSSDQFSDYLIQYDENTLSANCFIEVHIVNMIKESKFKGLAKLANIAWQTLLFASESLAMDKKVTPNLTQKQ